MLRNNPFNIQKKQQGKIKSTDCQFVGAHLPRQLAEYLALWAVYYKVPKSYIIRSILESRIPLEKPVNILINTLIKRAIDGWSQEQRSIHHSTKEDAQNHFEQYKLELKYALQKRGLPSTYILNILQTLSEKVEFDK